MANKGLGEGTVTAADIEPSKILRNVEPVEKNFPDQTTPAAHQPLVRFSISEKLVRLAHVDWLGFGSKADMCGAKGHVR